MSEERLQKIERKWASGYDMTDEKEFIENCNDFEWLMSEVERLKAENAESGNSYNLFKKHFKQQLAESQQKAERLEKALKYYANPSTYYFESVRDGLFQSQIDKDVGEKARQALLEKEGGTT